ncbi:MAG: copper oxidase, partial [Proteobacteria bacterium]|nr:copper oxidase [Pseudomonadota bacterium]
MTKRPYLTLTILILVLIAVAVQFAPGWFQKADVSPPATAYSRAQGDTTKIEVPCSNEHTEWRQAQVIDGVDIAAAPACEPDNPYDIAASVKGTNAVSMATLMQSNLAQDALVMGEDVDHDGDPDVVHLKLEVVEFNGASPDGDYFINTYNIAPGMQPGLWAYAPKSRGMALKN